MPSKLIQTDFFYNFFQVAENAAKQYHLQQMVSLQKYCSNYFQSWNIGLIGHSDLLYKSRTVKMMELLQNVAKVLFAANDIILRALNQLLSKLGMQR